MPNERKLSVLVIQPWLNYRGAETLSIQLAQDLFARGHFVKIFCLFVTDAITNDISSEILLLPNRLWQRLLRNQFMFVVFGFWVMLFYVYKSKDQFSIYNPHNFPSVWVAVVIAGLSHKRVVWTVHNFPQHPFRGVFGMLYELVISPIDRILVTRCDEIVSVSKKVFSEVYEKYSKKSDVVYPGIDLDFFGQVEDKDEISKLMGNNRIILHVAQIRSEKRQQFTLDLFSRIYKDLPDAVLVFVGEGDKRKLTFDHEALDSRIRFMGKISKKKLRSWYAYADVLLYPSAWGEGCTLVPMEAMASGVKDLLVVQGCGVDEILESKDFVFSTLDEAEFKIRNILNSANKVDLRLFMKDYSREKFADRYVEIFS